MPESPNDPNTTPDGTPTVHGLWAVLFVLGAGVGGLLAGLVANCLLHEPTTTRWPEPTSSLPDISHYQETPPVETRFRYDAMGNPTLTCYRVVGGTGPWLIQRFKLDGHDDLKEPIESLEQDCPVPSHKEEKR